MGRGSASGDNWVLSALHATTKRVESCQVDGHNEPSPDSPLWLYIGFKPAICGWLQ